MEIVLAQRYRGPLTSANGGYACGRHAAFVDANEVEVTLRLPPPLDRPQTPTGGVRSEVDAIDLLDTAGAPVLKRVAPALGAVVLLLLVVLLVRRLLAR